MICPNCRSDVPATANWCPQCGFGSQSAPAGGGKLLALAGVLSVALVLSIMFILSKTGTPIPDSSAGPQSASSLAVGQRVGREGPFEVFVSERESPSIRVRNASGISLVFTVEDDDGKQYTMEVPPDSDRVLDVPVGTYRAEVRDPMGFIRSAQGTANLQSHREYRAGFTIGFGGRNEFYIGD
jgi:hypothetical protein